MRQQQDGDLEVSMGETVTVEIEAISTAFLAHTGPLQVGQWSTLDHPSTTKEVRSFVVGSAFSTHFTFVTGFDFSLTGTTIASTARYRVSISGTGPGGFIRRSTVRPTSILPTTLAFAFEVGEG